MWNKIEDKIPEINQEVWYFFDVTGVHRGQYYGVMEDPEEPGKFWSGMHEFGGEYGWLTGDVTHWQPYTGQEKPEAPAPRRSL